MHTLVNALVLQGKIPPVQVAAGDDDHDCKWSIFASWWKEKHHLSLCKLHLVSASHFYTCAQDGLDTVQLALVVFFLGALAHLLMCAQMNRYTLQLALCGGSCGCGGIFMWWL